MKTSLLEMKRHPFSFLVRLLVMLAAAVTLAVLLFMILFIAVNGIPNLKPGLFAPQYNSENVSLIPALVNTLIMTVLCLLIALPLGVFSAIYLVEYAKKGSKMVQIIRMTAETLSGIPSIIYGLFGMLFFCTAFGGYSLLAGTLTMVIMVLPLVMRTTEEALISVPDMYREASFGLGAGKLRTIFALFFRRAVPGILSGVILATGRVVGETAALIYTAGTVAQIPDNLMKSGRTLAIHMYSLSREGMHMQEAYATAVVLLAVVILMNWVSDRIAKKLEKIR